MAERFDVLVVGAGIVGLASARLLARAGKRVLLIDRGPPGAEASGASAGMLAAQIEATAGDPLLRLAVEARECHAALAAECEAAGHHVGLVTRGISVIAFDDRRAAELEAQAAAQRALGLEAAWLTRAELLALHPGISPLARGALHAPKDGCVDNTQLCSALLAACTLLGVRVATDEVVAIETQGSEVAGVRTSRRRHRAGTVVLAPGAWAGAIEGLPHTLPMEPARGQMAMTPWPDGQPMGILFGNAGYIVPRGSNALLGTTMERVGFEKGTTESGLAHIRRETTAILPALAGAPFTKTWSGLRPMTPDGLPILGFDPDVEGLVYATGHGRNGILLGPITGEIVRDLVVRGETSWDISAYSIMRFTG